MILVDTSILVDFLGGRKVKGSQKFKLVLQQAIPFGITPLTYQDLLQGATSEKEYGLLRKYLETQRFYHPREPVNSYARAASIYFDCRKNGVTLRSTIDCIIAQTAIDHDLLLLHNDNDFDAMASIIPLKIYK
jgi:predicted nucleic acid-binding protein